MPIGDAQQRSGAASRLRPPAGAALALWAALALAIAPAAAATASRYSVEAAEFVVSVTDGEGGEHRIASTLVPYLPDRACFGWRIRLAEAPPVVRVREVLRLPEPPAFWSGEGDAYSPHVFSADRTTATTEAYQAPLDGWLANEWCIAEGDPTGAHSIEVFIEGERLRRFEFEVRRPGERPFP